MLDTGFDNPLTASDTGLEDSTLQAETSERLYDYVNQRESGDGVTLYWDNHVTPVTAMELQQLYNAPDNGQLRDAFGSFENYLAYMDERQTLIDSGELRADWWTADEALIDINTMNPDDDRATEQEIRNVYSAYAEQSYNKGSAALDSLYRKYTGEGLTRYNGDGDKFQWNGSSFVKTIKVDDSFNVNNFILTLAAAGITAGAASGLAGILSTKLGISQSMAQAWLQAGIDIARTGEVDLMTAISLAGADIPGIGSLDDTVEGGQTAIDAAISAVVDEILNPDNYGSDPANQPVWTDIDIEGTEGEFDPDADSNPYDPDLIDPQLPQYPDEEGGGGATDGSPESDPNAPTSGGESEGKYVVIEDNGDGTVTVRDTVDGDIWIVEGDYQVGDVIPESEMADARGANPDMTNGPTDLDKEEDDGSLPTLIPPFPETEIPDDPPAEPPPDEVVVDTTTDTSTDPAPTQTDSSLNTLCSMPRPEQYGFGQVAWDKYCGGQSEDGTEGTNDGSDASGDEGQNGTDSGGDGPGENGDNGNSDNGDGPSSANQWVDGKGGASKTAWTPLFPGYQFKPRRDFTRGMLSSRTPQTNFTLDDYTKQRMGLLSSAFKDLA